MTKTRIELLKIAATTLRDAGGEDMYDVADAIDRTRELEHRAIETLQTVREHVWDLDGKVWDEVRTLLDDFSKSP